MRIRLNLFCGHWCECKCEWLSSYMAQCWTVGTDSLCPVTVVVLSLSESSNTKGLVGILIIIGNLKLDVSILGLRALVPKLSLLFTPIFGQINGLKTNSSGWIQLLVSHYKQSIKVN